MSEKQTNYEMLKTFALLQGATLFGVADIGPLKKSFYLSPSELKGMKYGIALGVPLSQAVLDGIKDQPTLLYKWHYRQANNLLDKMAFLVTKEIMEQGYRALPVPASQIIDWEQQLGSVSHRTLGEAAGLGWRGRNNLLVNPKYGSQFRLVSILTNLPLSIDLKQGFQCGSCFACVKSCPAQALGNEARDYHLEKCYTKLTSFSKQRGIGAHICGICVKACHEKS